jgi:hypothetical protein
MVDNRRKQVAYERFTNNHNELILGITDELRDEETMEELDAEFAALGYKRDEDYEWGIAGGDDLPHCFIITSEKLKQDEKALNILSFYEGASCYDNDDSEGEEEDEEDEQ